jgi:hypothetical protein
MIEQDRFGHGIVRVEGLCGAADSQIASHRTTTKRGVLSQGESSHGDIPRHG